MNVTLSGCVRNYRAQHTLVIVNNGIIDRRGRTDTNTRSKRTFDSTNAGLLRRTRLIGRLPLGNELTTKGCRVIGILLRVDHLPRLGAIYTRLKRPHLILNGDALSHRRNSHLIYMVTRIQSFLLS